MGKSVLITGCSENTIGNALAHEFAKRQWTVYATARNPNKMANLKSIPNIKLIALDVMDGKTVFAAREQIAHDQGGKLDLLYHNAGVRSMSMAIDYNISERKSAETEEPYIRSDDTWMFEGNVTSVMALTRAFSKLIIAAKGTVAISGSGSGRAPLPGSGTYNATKAAIEMYSRTLRVEMQPFGVHVVYVMTGAVATPMNLQRLDFANDSPYKPIADKIAAGWEPEKGVEPMSTEDYGRYVVDHVARTNPPHLVWSGTGVNILWWLQKLGLFWMVDGIVAGRYGLNKPIA
jgi:1-acylglycerone phosphate reductase